MKVEPIVLEGRVVRLEPLEKRHAADLAAAATRKLFDYHFPPAELNEEGFRSQISGLSKLPGWCPFAIVMRETGQAVGVTCFLGIQEAHRNIEVGFTWVGEAFQGSAVNPEAKFLLLSHAFDVLGAIRVQLKTDERNLQSQAAISKLGAVREGTLRKSMILPDGHHRNSVMFSITDEEWPVVQRRLSERLQELAEAS